MGAPTTSSPQSEAQSSGRKPAVSWLLCTHVADEQLRLAVQSCLHQDFEDFELVLIVNGAKAQEVLLAVTNWFGHDQRVKIFCTEVRHLIFSLSLGLHHACGEFVARMDSDDLSTPDRLTRQCEYMRKHPDVAVLGTAYTFIDAQGSATKTVQPPKTDVDIRRTMLWRNPMCHPSVMFRRKVVLEVGGYLGGLHAEDYDLWLRLSAHPSYKFANLAEVCLGYRVIGVGTARRARAAYASMAAAQMQQFVNGRGWRWILAALVSVAKALVRARRTGGEA
jgi:cellulose synthase/poly-beta-1,6-N-acetylglucosamine synthase-like glycosyltransferase